MNNYTYVLEDKIIGDLPMLLYVLILMSIALIISIYRYKKNKKKIMIGFIIYFSLFLFFILVNLGVPIALISYDYLAGCEYIRLVGVVDQITGDHSNQYLVINSTKYNLPRIFNIEITNGDLVEIVYAERSKCIVNIYHEE